MPHINNDNYLEKNTIFLDSHCYNLGEFHVKEKRLKHNLLLAYISMQIPPGNKPPRVESTSNFRGIGITLNLEGGCSLENRQFAVKSEKGSTNILYTPQASGVLSFQADSHSSISLMIGDNFLDECFFKYLNIDLGKDKILKNQRTSLLTWICFRDLVTSPYDGVLGQMFAEGKVLEIITNEFGSILTPKSKVHLTEKVILTTQDTKALNKAWQILIDNIDNPPSIKELARKVAINECKLKTGFKQLFGITPYSVVRSHRMKIAKKLLESSEYNVSEVSKIVGIKNQAHFTRTFYDCYKILPRDVMKNRKYFY